MNKKLPTAAIVAFLTIFAIEIIFLASAEPLTGLPYLQPTADDAVIVAKRSLMNKASTRMVIIGDSSAMHGIEPSILHDKTGKNFLNLATLASMTITGYCELGKELLLSPNKPQALILAALPQTFEFDSEKVDEMGQLGRYLISYHAHSTPPYNPTTNDYIQWFAKKHRFNIFPPEFGGSFANLQMQLSASDGYLAEKKNHINHDRKIGRFKASELSIRATNELFLIAQKQNIPIYFILTPKPSSLVSEQYEADTRIFLRSIKAEFPFVRILQDSAPRWGDELFSTETHLNHFGSKLFSEILANMIINSN